MNAAPQDPVVTLTLPLGFVNYALSCAADRPYKEAEPFITKVRTQTQLEVDRINAESPKADAVASAEAQPI